MDHLVVMKGLFGGRLLDRRGEHIVWMLGRSKDV